MVNLKDRLRKLYDATAGAYESKAGHTIPADEDALWRADLGTALDCTVGRRTLDIGAGTGVFTRFLAAQGFSVTGIEPSAEMIAQAKAQDSGAVSFIHGPAEAAEQFEAQSFHLIAARQSACCFDDPIAVFSGWHRLLVQGGCALVIEGIWSRQSWDDDVLIDGLPLSCVHTRATIPYLLRSSGFRVGINDWLCSVNRHHGVSNGAPGSRYFVLASK
jgi:ubiquinone/menaquinone biosynthesis C-methylase UbiE